MRNLKHIAVVGVTGYTGFELARILVRHPGVEASTFYMRDTQRAKCLDELFPQLRGRGDAPLQTFSVEAIVASRAGTAFLATPHDVSRDLAPELVEAGMRVVDLSGAFRFRSEETFTNWYKMAAAPGKWLAEAVYGLPEIYADKIKEARIVANPGCYATSVILALRPLTDAGLDCRRTAEWSAIANRERAARAKNCDAICNSWKWMTISRPTIFFRTGTRRKSWSTPGSAETQVIFSTHLLPISRGILSTIYVHLEAGAKRRSD